jgi:predicted porin
MKNFIIAFALLILAMTAQAKTSIYGEANARVQTFNNEQGSTLNVDGSLSEFGFKGEQPISEQNTAVFDMLLGVEALAGFSPYLKQGSVSIQGDFGEVAAFYDLSPVAATSQYLSLMNNDADSIWLLLGYTGNAFTPQGINRVDGLSYKSPRIEDKIVLHTALIPAETINGSTGVSFAGQYDQGPVDMAVGFEVNVEQAHSQLFRMVGEYQLDNLKLGGLLQISSNSDNDYSARTFAAFAKLPIKFSQLETNNRLMFGLSTETDPLDESSNQFYTSVLQEIPWNNKVSSYSFLEVLLANDLNDLSTSGGAGLKISF